MKVAYAIRNIEIFGNREFGVFRRPKFRRVFIIESSTYIYNRKFGVYLRPNP